MQRSALISSKIKAGLQAVEKEIENACQTEVLLLRRAALDTLSAGGKRLRPALVLISGQIGHYDLDQLVPAAAAVELIHMASLVHDDILDGATTRRGMPTINSQWGTTTAINTGDFLFAQAFILFAKLDNAKVTKTACRAALALSQGELQQIRTSGNCNQNVDDYLDKIYKKTAALFVASCEVGSLLAHASPDETALLAEYGMNLGMAFQIYDDILDLEGSEEKLGKPIGIDLKDGTVTLPVLYALEETNQDLRICAVIDDNDPKQEEIEAAIDLILSTNAMERTKIEARKYTEEAIKAAQKIESREVRDDLAAIGEFVVARYC